MHATLDGCEGAATLLDYVLKSIIAVIPIL